MKNIIFVCHGNICRSVAAEYIAKSIVKQLHLENSFIFSSKAVSNEEIGNDIYPPMKRVLLSHNIEISLHHASKITNIDYFNSDLIFYMDESNLYYLKNMFPNDMDKIHPIYLYNKDIIEIEDPWYTGRYELVFSLIYKCVMEIILKLK